MTDSVHVGNRVDSVPNQNRQRKSEKRILFINVGLVYSPAFAALSPKLTLVVVSQTLIGLPLYFN